MPTFTYNNTFTNFLVSTIPTFKHSDTMTISSVNYVYFHVQQHFHKFPAISSLSSRTITTIPAVGCSGCYLSTISSFLRYLLSLAALSPLFHVLALPVSISVLSLVSCYVLLFVAALSHFSCYWLFQLLSNSFIIFSALIRGSIFSFLTLNAPALIISSFVLSAMSAFTRNSITSCLFPTEVAAIINTLTCWLL